MKKTNKNFIRKPLKYLIFSAWMLVNLPVLTAATPADSLTFKWLIGEELTYKVKWAFIRLGTLKLQVIDTTRIDSQRVYHTRLLIDSNPLLFFVNMHSVFESYIDENFYPHLFVADETIDGVTYKTYYRFNHPERLVDVRMTDVEDTTRIIEKQIPMEETFQDGMSLIFFTRGNVRKGGTYNLTAFYEAKIGKLLLRVREKKSRIKIEAFNQLVDAFEVDGKANFKAIAGFQGKFRGWFATDRYAPPLYALLKVFIGNVSVELESWEKWPAPFISDLKNSSTAN